MSIGNIIKEIYKISPNEKVRLGRNYDGGYVICPDLKYDCILGCGVNDDVSFEEDLLKQTGKIPCYLFDGTINTLPTTQSKFTFINKNIGAFESPFTTNMNDLLTTYSSIFLKMDIEEGEYDWFKYLEKNEKVLNNISQITMEFHTFRSKHELAKKFIKFLSKHF